MALKSRDCPAGYSMNSNGVCQENYLRRSSRLTKDPITELSREETCFIRGNVYNINGQLVASDYKHCFPQGCQHYDRDTASAWFSTCTCASWGDNYPCGNYACGTYFFGSSGYSQTSPSLYCDGPPVQRRSWMRKGGKVTRRKGRR